MIERTAETLSTQTEEAIAPAQREAIAQAQPEGIALARRPAAIRERCGVLFELGCDRSLSHFDCDLTKLEQVADYVISVIRHDYPDLQIPFHSRWRHFEAGGVPRLAALDQQLAGLTPVEAVKAKFDLAIASVLLDAGAGPRWQYCDRSSGQIFRRSEGLAVASFQMFLAGAFSSNPQRPLQVDSQGLQQLTLATLETGFQANAENKVVGISGRLQLLQNLGRVLNSSPQMFGSPRPGNLVNYLLGKADNGQLAAETVLSAVLAGFGDIWPGRLVLGGVNLGDVWHHPAVGGDGLVPFHKLSQWLTYSLLEPLQELVEITNLDALTGLPEYRNGGLCVDLGLLQPKHPAVLQQPHLVDSEVIVEWRALTVILLDHIAATIREKLNMTASELPLVKILQGGTWTAGRRIAAQKRTDGIPPIQIESDGTVF